MATPFNTTGVRLVNADNAPALVVTSSSHLLANPAAAPAVSYNVRVPPPPAQHCCVVSETVTAPPQRPAYVNCSPGMDYEEAIRPSYVRAVDRFAFGALAPAPRGLSTPLRLRHMPAISDSCVTTASVAAAAEPRSQIPRMTVQPTYRRECYRMPMPPPSSPSSAVLGVELLPSSLRSVPDISSTKIQHQLELGISTLDDDTASVMPCCSCCNPHVRIAPRPTRFSCSSQMTSQNPTQITSAGDSVSGDDVPPPPSYADIGLHLLKPPTLIPNPHHQEHLSIARSQYPATVAMLPDQTGYDVISAQRQHNDNLRKVCTRLYQSL